MKKMLVVIGMIATAGILYACGGSSSGSKTGGGSTTTTSVAAPTIAATKTAISTPAEAAKSVNASKTLASSFASGSSFPSIGSLVNKPTADQAADGHRIISTVRDLQKRALALQQIPKKIGKYAAAPAGGDPVPCGVSGTKVVVYDSANGNITMTANNCKEDYELSNGTISISGVSQGSNSGSGGTVVMNVSTTTYANGGYTTKESESVQNLTMTIGSFDVNAGSETITMNGFQSDIDYISKTSEKQSFGNFSLNMTESTGSISMALDGSVSMDTFNDTAFTAIDTASGMTFQHLAIVETVTSTSTALTINGTFAIKTIPACMDGTFTITTESPITTSSTTGKTTGQMTVNGVVMVFNADGTVTATINGTPQIIQSVENACSLSF